MSHVTVKLKRPIILHLQNSTTHYPKGLNLMPKHHAEHPFVRLNQEGQGVKQEPEGIAQEAPPHPPMQEDAPRDRAGEEVPEENEAEEEKDKKKRGSK